MSEWASGWEAILCGSENCGLNRMDLGKILSSEIAKYMTLRKYFKTQSYYLQNGMISES